MQAVRPLIEQDAEFLPQLEQASDTTFKDLRIKGAAGVTTIFNPAPAAPLPDVLLALCE